MLYVIVQCTHILRAAITHSTKSCLVVITSFDTLLLHVVTPCVMINPNLLTNVETSIFKLSLYLRVLEALQAKGFFLLCHQRLQLKWLSWVGSLD